MRLKALPFLITYFLITACSSVNPIEQIIAPIDSRDTLTEALTQITASGDVPGISVVVVKGGKPVYLRSFGIANPLGSSPANSESEFNLWSISKVFTALAVTHMASKGKVDLDKPACIYLDWYEAASCDRGLEDAQQSKRTIRSLLEHTAGIPDIGMKLYGKTEFHADPLQSQQKLALELLPEPKKWSDPDNASRYSNSHYLLLAAIVESVSGQAFANYMQQAVFAPLQLTHTAYRNISSNSRMSGSHPVDLTSFFAFFYVDKQQAVQSKTNGRYWFNPLYNASLGSTGATSNSTDMALFMTSMLSCLANNPSTVLGESCEMIRSSPPKTVEKSPARGVTGLTQQLGWFVSLTDKGSSYSHGGSGMGFTSMLQLYPEQQLGVFVVANDTYFDRRGGLLVAQAIANLDW